MQTLGTRPHIIKQFVLLLLLSNSALLAGCSIFGDDREERTANMIETELYESAVQSLDRNQYTGAIRYLESLEARFPFGNYAEQAQLELIYAYFSASDHEAAISAAERFIRLHPEHPNVDYAYYMLGLISYNRERTFIGQFLPVDATSRDPGSARESFTHFSQLLALFPDSQYAPDARKRMLYLRNLLARHEINVANYYFKRGAIVAATNRGKYVVENYQGSPAVPDGLAVMAQGYTMLGLANLADDAIRVLHENYPEHPALDENGNFIQRDILSGQDRSWLNQVTFGLLDRPEPVGFDTRYIYNPEYQQAEEDAEEDPGLLDSIFLNRGGGVSDEIQQRRRTQSRQL